MAFNEYEDYLVGFSHSQWLRYRWCYANLPSYWWTEWDICPENTRTIITETEEVLFSFRNSGDCERFCFEVMKLMELPALDLC